MTSKASRPDTVDTDLGDPKDPKVAAKTTDTVVNTTQGPLPYTPQGHVLAAGETAEVDAGKEPVAGLIADGYLYVLGVPEAERVAKSRRKTNKEG